MTITTVQTQTTQTAAFTGPSIVVSGITSDWTLKLNVAAMSDSGSSTPLVRFSFEDTVNDFTGSLAGPAISFKGAVSSSADRVASFKKADFPDLRLGVANAELHLKLTNIESGGTVTYSAWLEY
jgi:hypothetical protein